MGKINFEKETYYGSEKLYRKWMNKGECKKGDIIMTMEAPLGNITQIPNDKKYILSQRVILLRAKEEKVENDYLAYFLISYLFQSQLNRYASGTTAQGIQQAKLITLLVKFPKSKKEQRKIAEVLIEIDQKTESEENQLSKLLKMKMGLMQDLLTGKIRVDIRGKDGTKQ
jgi:type I restriction enzyme S subunit